MERGEPDNKYILRNSSRAMHVTGEVLKGASSGGRLTGVGTWVAQLGAWFSGLTEAAIPGTIPHMVVRHFGMLFSFLAAMLVAAAVFVPPLRSLLAPGVTILVALALLSVLLFVLSSLMKSWSNKWVRALGTIVLLLVALALLGSFLLGARDIYCGGRSVVRGHGMELGAKASQATKTDKSQPSWCP